MEGFKYCNSQPGLCCGCIQKKISKTAAVIIFLLIAVAVCFILFILGDTSKYLRYVFGLKHIFCILLSQKSFYLAVQYVCTVAQNFGYDLLHFSMQSRVGNSRLLFWTVCHNLFTLSLTIYFWILSYLPCSLFVLSPNNHTLPNKQTGIYNIHISIAHWLSSY